MGGNTESQEQKCSAQQAQEPFSFHAGSPPSRFAGKRELIKHQQGQQWDREGKRSELVVNQDRIRHHIGVALGVGDAVSPYQQAVNTEIGRRQMNASGRDAAESAVRNAIANAKKLEWGLHEADDWMQRKTRGEMKAALDDAKYAAEKNGIALPGEYYDLLKKVDEGAPNDTNVGGGDTVLADTQRIEGLVRNKNLHDKDIQGLYAKADKMGDNSSEAAKLRALADKYKNSTVEKKDENEKARSEAERDAGLINSIKNKDMRRSEYFNGSKNLKKFYDFDEKTSMVVKKKGA